jgi:outer membrane protein OmpA-like peptidoglycan-associated protein
MKHYLIILALAIFTFSTHAQVKVDVEKKINNEANQRANSNTDKAIDKAFDSVEEGIGNLFKKKDKKGKNNASQNNVQVQDKNSTKQATAGTETIIEKEVQNPVQPNVQWSKFDFVPGDEVIFEDAPGVDEENGEFPSRWDLIGGQVEIASVDGEQVLMFLDGGQIIPYLKNSAEDYLPEVFTIEFDYYKPKDGNRITIYLTDQKNQRGKGIYNDAQEFDITPLRVDAPGGITAEHSGRDYTYCEDGCWTHISLAYTKGKLKVYLDDTRVINIPHYEFNPTGFTYYPYFADAGEGKAFYAKNFRIAKGGVKYYDRVLSNGKIIVNGIRFDVNKATIKPESNGAINEIFELMQKQPELNFSVEGHTDSDGDVAINQKLSEERAKAVMDRLISMGIPSSRLKSVGWGESKPIGENGTPEGKANNRRVEFVKF